MRYLFLFLLGGCTNITYIIDVGNDGGENDASVVVSDMESPSPDLTSADVDFAVSADLATPADLSSPADLATTNYPDLACGQTNPNIDGDGDGWTPAQGDTNDCDQTIHPYTDLSIPLDLTSIPDLFLAADLTTLSPDLSTKHCTMPSDCLSTQDCIVHGGTATCMYIHYDSFCDSLCGSANKWYDDNPTVDPTSNTQAHTACWYCVNSCGLSLGTPVNLDMNPSGQVDCYTNTFNGTPVWSFDTTVRTMVFNYTAIGGGPNAGFATSGGPNFIWYPWTN